MGDSSQSTAPVFTRRGGSFLQAFALHFDATPSFPSQPEGKIGLPRAQEAGQVVWYSHLFQNFPQFIVIHIVKGFGIVNKAEIDVDSRETPKFTAPLPVSPFTPPDRDRRVDSHVLS